MSEPVPPVIAVSPRDKSSDRAQSDVDQAGNLERNTSDRVQSDADQVLTIARLDQLIEVSGQLSASAVDVATSTRQELATANRQRRRFQVTMLALAVLMVGLMIPLLINVTNGVASRKEIADCVQPTGQCFKAGQIRTGNAVDTLNKVTVLAAACAPDYVGLPLPQRTAAIRACIQAGLK